MNFEDGISFDLSRYYGAADEQRDLFVVLRGYKPGCTNKIGAILATHGLEDSLVLCFDSEAVALDHWRRELTVGQRVECIGGASAEERSAYTRSLRQDIDAMVIRESRWKASRSSRALPPLSPPARRTDSISVPRGLRSSTTSTSAASSRTVIGLVKSEDQKTGRDIIDHSLNQPSSSGPVSSLPVNYAPPPDRGQGYLPANLPHPVNAVRGTSGKRNWYFVPRSRNPGIYASWDDVKASNAGAAREFYNEGADTYEEALGKWVTARETRGGIQRFA
ncbi:unnamed protein product [Peniophora sp. CBMAI 1063]|nr:unnamed protein product [Peniophora sp. CBMAI 1063]